MFYGFKLIVLILLVNNFADQADKQKRENMSSKQAVKVVIRTRPTADFASKNVEIDANTGAITLK